RLRLKKRTVEQFVQTLPVTGSEKFKRTRGPPRCPQQTFASRVLANGFEQSEKALLHRGDASSATALNFADAAFSRLQFSFDFGISVPHWINLAGLGAVSRSGGLQSAKGDLEIARPWS